MDKLEAAAALLEKTEWEIFKEQCEQRGYSHKRTEALWEGWCQEDFIPLWMLLNLQQIITNLREEL